MKPLRDTWRKIYAAVRRIPRGRVATYGDVGWAVGMPRGGRLVGTALAALRGTRHDVPWQRVLGARGTRHAGVSILDPVGAAAQRDLLEREGVRFDARGRVALAEFGSAGTSRRLERLRAAPPGAARPPRARVTPPPAPASPARSPRRTAGSSGRTRTGRSGRR